MSIIVLSSLGRLKLNMNKKAETRGTSVSEKKLTKPLGFWRSELSAKQSTVKVEDYFNKVWTNFKV